MGRDLTTFSKNTHKMCSLANESGRKAHKLADDACTAWARVRLGARKFEYAKLQIIGIGSRALALIATGEKSSILELIASAGVP